MRLTHHPVQFFCRGPYLDGRNRTLIYELDKRNFLRLSPPFDTSLPRVDVARSHFVDE